MTNQQTVQRLGKILGVWAHPDDEAWSAAGLMKMAADNGQRVGIVTATKGDAGKSADEQKWPTEKLGEIRMSELGECLKCVGDVTQYNFEYKDGSLEAVDKEEVLKRLKKIVDEFKPDTILTFERMGITGHADHKTVYTWCKQLQENLDRPVRLLCAIETIEKYQQAGEALDKKHNIFFNVETPRLIHESDAGICLKLSDEYLACKMKCIAAHKSQTSVFFTDKASVEKLKILAQTECFESE